MTWHEQRDGETAAEWYRRVVRDERANLPTIMEVHRAYKTEREWLLASLKNEGRPEWLIEMVLAQWGEPTERPGSPERYAAIAESITSRMGPPFALDELLVGTTRE